MQLNAAKPHCSRSALLQLLSFITYCGSMWHQDRILRFKFALGNVLGPLNLLAVMIICARGSSCLKKGVRTNLLIVGLSLLIVMSTVLTNRGHLGAGMSARFIVKSAKIIPTLGFESLLNKKRPVGTRLAGCLILTVGCLLYFGSTTWRPQEAARDSSYMTGIGFLLIGALLDSFLTVSENHLFLKRGAAHPLTSLQLAFGCACWSTVAFGFGFLSSCPSFDLDYTILDDINSVYTDVLAFTAFASIAYYSNVLLIHEFGAIYSQSFKLCRKIACMVLFALLNGVILTPSVLTALTICTVGLWFVGAH
jgi:hypothetical protein